MRTPEGKVKDAVKEFLHSRKVQSLVKPIPDAVGFYWMPVPHAMGSPFLDFVICYKGQFIAYEAKADRLTEPTTRQKLIITMVREGRGCAFWGAEEAVGVLSGLFDSIDQRERSFGKAWGNAFD